jgi:hypothetical protein
MLRDHGVPPGDRVACMSPLTPEVIRWIAEHLDVEISGCSNLKYYS